MPLDSLGFETKREAEKTPDKAVRRWLLEIKLAQKREKDWRHVAHEILRRYRSKDRKKNSFNILWANTETLRPALYNSPPKPDVRRRFRQSDMLGKAVGELTERSLTYCADAYDLDTCIKQAVLDSLLPGRAIDRVRYVPSYKKVGITDGNATPDAKEKQEKDAAEPYEGEREEVEYEQALCEHVQWDDFLHGPGKTWDEVQWIAFKHKLRRDDLVEKFGKEIGEEIKLDATDDEDIQKKENEDLEGVFKRAELWEIWDKDDEKVFFLANSYKKDLLYPGDMPEGTRKGDPPLKLRNFYPVPRPLQMVEDTGTLIPEPLYELYREQAQELDRISTRINNLVNACRVRFAHDPSLTELSQLMEAGDNIGIPVQNARAWMNNGGLDKAIWWMPVDQIAKVLVELYTARDSCKQVIYELTGISDIVRGQTDPNETLGAQELKANYSNLRLARMQKETARYVRDLIRLLAEVIGENFDSQTLAKMTGMNFPTAMQKQQMQLQAQAMQQQNPQAPQLQAMQNALSMPTWEEIMTVLRSDMQREYRIDVETNSTVAETLTQDMSGLREVLTGLTEFWTGVGPAVQAGAIDIKAVKEISLTIVRRARMGLEVEDAIETGLKEPKPQADPAVQQAAQQAQVDQMKAAHDAKLAEQQQALEQQKAQADAQLAAAEEQRAQAVAAAEQQHEAEALRSQQAIEDQKRQYEARIADMEATSKEDIARYKVDKDNETKLAVAEIGAQASLDSAMAKADSTDGAAPVNGKRKTPTDKVAELVKELRAMHESMKQSMTDDAAPIEMDRGPDGRIAVMRKGKRSLKVNRSAKGIRLEAMQ